MERETLLNSIKEENSVELLSKKDDNILIYDYKDSKEICFDFNFSECHLLKKIWINKKFSYKYNLDKRKIFENIFKFIGKDALYTLKNIFLIYQLKDIKYICKKIYGNKKETLYFDYNNLYCNLIGQLYFEKNSIFINLKQIEKITSQISYGNIDFEDLFTRGIYTTCFHELRHLMLDTNIFLPEEDYAIDEASEENVERFARDCYFNMEQDKLFFESRITKK